MRKLAGVAAAMIMAVAMGNGLASEKELVAKYTEETITVDGKLDEKVWQNAAEYHLQVPETNLVGLPKAMAKNIGKGTREDGVAKLAWDKNYLYIAINFTDSDIYAEGKKDQEHHYGMGDVLEVFLKPENNTWYWELYGTPTSKKTSFFFPGRGAMFLPSAAEYKCDDLKVASQVNGTLNSWKDRDQNWTCEMAVPIKTLTENGDKFEAGAAWRVLVARYNYSRYLPRCELTCTPQMTQANWHLLEEYGWLKLEK